MCQGLNESPSPPIAAVTRRTVVEPMGRRALKMSEEVSGIICHPTLCNKVNSEQ